MNSVFTMRAASISFTSACLSPAERDEVSTTNLVGANRAAILFSSAASGDDLEMVSWATESTDITVTTRKTEKIRRIGWPFFLRSQLESIPRPLGCRHAIIGVCFGLIRVNSRPSLLLHFRSRAITAITCDYGDCITFPSP